MKIILLFIISLLFSVNAEEKKYIGIYEKIKDVENKKIVLGKPLISTSGDTRVKITQGNDSDSSKWTFNFDKPFNLYWITRTKKNNEIKINKTITRCSSEPSSKHIITLKRTLFLATWPDWNWGREADSFNMKYFERYAISDQYNSQKSAYSGTLERVFNNDGESEKKVLSINNFGKNLEVEINKEIELYRFYKKGKETFVSFSILFQEK